VGAVAGGAAAGGAVAGGAEGGVRFINGNTWYYYVY